MDLIESDMFGSLIFRQGKALQDVIKLALLVNLISPGTLHEFQTTSNDSQGASSMTSWRQFIDALSWLADSHPGGKTVAAICGVHINGHPRLLLASNGLVTKEVSGHVRNVLKVLRDLNKVGSDLCEVVLRDIIKSSIRVSRKKVHNYEYRLLELIQKIEQNSKRSCIDTESPLYRRLVNVRSLRGQHDKLCQWAYEYSKHPDFEALVQKCSIEPRVPFYRQIRHYIGRLGSWHRAASTLVLAATKIPDIIHDIQIETVAPQANLWPTAAAGGSLRSLIEELDIDLNTDHVLQNLQVFYNQTSQKRRYRCENIEQALTEQLADPKFKPITHAEVLLADYVFAGQLDFIYDDCYIGISKPACVLCRLYLEAHPLGLIYPRCHGNLWPQWSPPLFISVNPSIHFNIVAETMKSCLRQLLWNRLVYGQRDHLRLPDSATGITARTRNRVVDEEDKVSIPK